ncbi:hypothetical protein GA0074694_5061 [Micromonospora inyonensis]|uniref:Uncharacterized protein n=1 Tax=Micromonospora inyonensis TaxID=47866 RepID=A0A1C6SFQ5_9ACTN|nr:hypothetical protein GA0074694_5061 [Micromonospora inyonensis]
MFQYATVTIFLLGALYPLLAAAAGTGDWAGLADPGLSRYGDPKEWDPLLGGLEESWNPLLWIFGISRLVVMVSGITLLGVVGVVAGVVRLVGGGVGRGRFVALLVGTLLCAAVTVVMLTPYGAQLRTWLLD